MSLAPLHISFEFFPPRTEELAAKLHGEIKALMRWQPDFVTVTCGAGGSAHDGTRTLTDQLRSKFKLDVAPHVPMRQQSYEHLQQVLRDYKKMGVTRVVAIRGDASREPLPVAVGDAYPNTVDFVADLSANFGFEPIVAAYPDVHPLATSPQQDMDHLKRKVAAGAKRAVTQFFFEAETYLRFRDKVRKAGIDIPLSPGIMPIHNLDQVLKFAAGCGTAVPSGFAIRFRGDENDPAALSEKGVAHGIDLCERLRQEGVDHFHFYTLNRSEMTDRICQSLGLRQGAAR